MSDFSHRVTSLPPEQQAIQAKCFHPTGSFIEFTKDEIEQSIPERFEKMVQLHRRRLALKSRDHELTYEALNQAANRIAHAILSTDGKEDEPVALLLGKGVALTAAILGVLKAGRIYVLLNPAFPAARVSFILKNSRAGLLVTDSDHLSLATGFAGERLQLINVAELDSRLPNGNPDVSISPDAPTWITYTSGSTGDPKGVVQNHRNVLHLIMTQTNDLHICSQDRLAMLMSAAGDMFLALLNGSAIFPPNTKENTSDALGNWLIQEKITIYSSVPSVFRNFVNGLRSGQTFPELRLIRLTGEAVYRTDVEIYREHFSRNCILVNRLSSTEAPAFRQYFVDESTTITDNVVPVGYAVEGNEVSLVRDDGQEAGMNEVGEIAVMSRHLALGYWRNPELTEAKFSPVPGEAEQRIFKTGDLGRMSSDGCLVYLGRKDFQVKIRGHRVELAEIERALLSLEQFRDVVVVSLEDHPGEQRLVAYLVPVRGTPITASTLRECLSEKLPEYMIPSAFVVLDAMPVTPIGKVDRSALPAPGRIRPELNTIFVAPRTFLEKELAQVWEEILRLDRVGVHDNFFDLGGHSLMATRVVSRIIKTLQVEVTLQALFAAPTVAEMAAVITEHQARKLEEQDLNRNLAAKRAVVKHRLQEKGFNTFALESIPRGSERSSAPLSFAQHRLWFLNQFEPESPVYNESSGTRLSGSLDLPALERALNHIVTRHEVLRTTIVLIDGTPQQVVSPNRLVDLPVIDLRARTDEERDREVHRLMVETIRCPFDLSRDLMLRVLLLRLTDQEHVLLLVQHHIASDGWSMGILWQELTALYRAVTFGDPSPLPELPIQYADYAVWQRESLRGKLLTIQLAYWKKQLDNLPTLQLPTDRPRPPVQTHRGARLPLQLSSELLSELNVLSRREGVTLFMTLLAVFQILLHQYAGQDDIVVGSPIAARDRPELEGLIGFFANSLVLRADLSGGPVFKELLGRVRETALGAYGHQDVPFEKLVEELKPERNPSYSPLFQVAFAFQNTPSTPPKLEGLTLTSFAVDSGTAKFDLTLSLREEAEGLKGWLEYNTDLFDAATIRRMWGHFENLLKGIVANPEQRVSELPLLTQAERQQLLVEWNDTKRSYPEANAVHELFEAQVERIPDAVAVVFGEQQMTYADLNRDANRLARYLKRLGVGPGTLVGVCLERSLGMTVALLGILKAGGAYVPLDPAYPNARLAFILEDTQAALLLTQQPRLASLPKHPAKTVCLDRHWSEIIEESETNLSVDTTADDLAYVMYTSGSTGKPKGVEITHRGVVRLICGGDYARFDAKAVFLQLAPIAFDACTFELWGALLHGGRCVLFPGTIPTPQELSTVLHQHNVNTLWLTASLFNTVIDEAAHALSDIRQLLIGGEALSVPHVRRALSLFPQMEIINGYGPTEGTTFSCCYAIPKPFDKTINSVPIGRPIANTEVYILDRHLHPVPVGVPGELHIGGDGLARGYLNRSDLTAQSFIPNPFSSNPGARLYKTGDRACYLPDGNIEFLGRTDQQVKIRGFRIELGEIETVLAQHPAIRDTVILAREDSPGDKRLVAYVLPEPGCRPTADELDNFLRTKLPNYMVPSVFVLLDQLPLTPNGKVNRQALLKPDLSRAGPGEPLGIPRDHLERQLVNIWQTILSVQPIGVKDSFFDLGGHSLLAIRMMSQIDRAFGKKLPLTALFQAPTIEQLAKLLRDEFVLQPWSFLVPLQTGGSRPPFFWVHGEASDAVLPRYLGQHQPLYGLMHQSHDGAPARHTSVEDIAAHYLREIRTIEPKGPYYLGGYCFGGIVAFEIAQQLTKAAEEVALLALLVPSAPENCEFSTALSQNVSRSSINGGSFSYELQRHFRNLRILRPKDKISYILAKTKGKITGTALRISAPFRKMFKTVASKAYLGFGYFLPLSLRSFYILAVYRQALKNYVPKVYDGRLILLTTEGNFRAAPMWKQLALRGIEIHQVRGNHTEVLDEPYIEAWAEQLKDQLDRAQSWDSFEHSDAAPIVSDVNADVRQTAAQSVPDAVTQPHP